MVFLLCFYFTTQEICWSVKWFYSELYKLKNQKCHLGKIAHFTGQKNITEKRPSNDKYKKYFEWKKLKKAIKTFLNCRIVEIFLSQESLNVVNDEDDCSNTPLHLAALEGHVKVVAILLNSGAAVDARWTSTYVYK